MKPFFLIILLYYWFPLAWAQDIEDLVFAPSLEFGYMGYNSLDLTGGLMTRLSLEIRFDEGDNYFIRLNADRRTPRYQVESKVDSLFATLEGKSAFMDYLIGLGYRIGDDDIRGFGLLQFGATTYGYPSLDIDAFSADLAIIPRVKPISRLTTGIEFYHNSHHAFAIEGLWQWFWSNEDFWGTGSHGLGFTIGWTAAIVGS